MKDYILLIAIKKLYIMIPVTVLAKAHPERRTATASGLRAGNDHQRRDDDDDDDEGIPTDEETHG